MFNRDIQRLSRLLTAVLCISTGSAALAASKPPLVTDPQLPPASGSAPRVLLLGIDGVQLEELQQISTPNFNRLQVRKAYTGGVDGEASQQKTSSGPGWSTILTGVWANKHQITANDSDLANP